MIRTLALCLFLSSSLPVAAQTLGTTTGGRTEDVGRGQARAGYVCLWQPKL
jgi:hypothetical protein